MVRLPIEHPVERVRFAATAGLLAVERGDDPLAVRLLARADGEGRDVGLVRVLRVAVAARGVHPVDPALALAECVGRCRPARLVEAARWALHGGVPAATVEDLVGDAVGAAPQLRLLLAVAAGRDAAAVDLLPAALHHGDPGRSSHGGGAGRPNYGDPADPTTVTQVGPTTATRPGPTTATQVGPTTATRPDPTTVTQVGPTTATGPARPRRPRSIRPR